MGFSKILRNKNTIKENNGLKLVLEKDGNLISAVKADNNEGKIEKLNFTYDDFPEESDIEDQMPWHDFKMMTNRVFMPKK